jgi:hypothetical protein
VDPLPLSCTCKGSNVTVINYPHDMQFTSSSVVVTMEEALEVVVPTKCPRIYRDSQIAAVLAPTYTANMAGSSLGNADVSCGLLIRPTSWPTASAVAKRTYSSKHKQ